MNETTHDSLIVVAIPTYRRPEQLSHLLEALQIQEAPPAFQLLIGDNDPIGGAGLAVAERCKNAGYPVPIEAFGIAERGLCSVRNSLFERALLIPDMTHLALIDDDEWPDPTWLATLMAQQRATGADAVGGPIRAFFPDGKPKWADEVFLFRPEERSAGVAAIIYGTNNALMTRELLETTPRPWFDPAFNTTGGEDLDLFTRLRRDNRRFAWAPDAWVTEWVPKERARISWVMRRLWRIGNTDTAVAWKRGNIFKKMRLIPHTIAFVGFASLALPIALLPGQRRIDHLGRWVRALGRIAGLIFRPINEYGDFNAQSSISEASNKY